MKERTPTKPSTHRSHPSNPRRGIRPSRVLASLVPLFAMLGCDFIPGASGDSEVPDESELPQEIRFIVAEGVTLCSTDSIVNLDYLDAFESKHTISIEPGIFTNRDIKLSGTISTRKGGVSFETLPFGFEIIERDTLALNSEIPIDIDAEHRAELDIEMYAEPNQKWPTFVLDSLERMRSQEGFKVVSLDLDDRIDLLGKNRTPVYRACDIKDRLARSYRFEFNEGSYVEFLAKTRGFQDDDDDGYSYQRGQTVFAQGSINGRPFKVKDSDDLIYDVDHLVKFKTYPILAARFKEIDGVCGIAIHPVLDGKLRPYEIRLLDCDFNIVEKFAPTKASHPRFKLTWAQAQE